MGNRRCGCWCCRCLGAGGWQGIVNQQGGIDQGRNLGRGGGAGRVVRGGGFSLVIVVVVGWVGNRRCGCAWWCGGGLSAGGRHGIVDQQGGIDQGRNFGSGCTWWCWIVGGVPTGKTGPVPRGRRGPHGIGGGSRASGGSFVSRRLHQGPFRHHGMIVLVVVVVARGYWW